MFKYSLNFNFVKQNVTDFTDYNYTSL